MASAVQLPPHAANLRPLAGVLLGDSSLTVLDSQVSDAMRLTPALRVL